MLGLGRMVVETRDRLGADATPEAVAAELAACGVAAGMDDIRRYWNEPN